jgi:hypothetical protein
MAIAYGGKHQPMEFLLLYDSISAYSQIRRPRTEV